MPTDAYNRDSLAHFYATEHLKTDPGITKVVYLPTDAPDREIRLLEINELLQEDHTERQLIPIDFGVDMGEESEHKLFVVDLTGDQWDKVREGKLELPDGWSLTAAVEVPDE